MAIDSEVDLNLGNVPNIEDPVVYEAILAIHNALEAILAGTSASNGAAYTDAFVARLTNITVTSAFIYYVLGTDGAILASGSVNDCTVVLPTAADVVGYEFIIKCVDNTNTVLVQGSGVALIDTHSAIELNLHDSITVKSDGNDWWIM